MKHTMRAPLAGLVVVALVLCLTICSGCGKKLPGMNKQPEPPPPPPVSEAGKTLEQTFLSSINSPEAVNEPYNQFLQTYKDKPEVQVIMRDISRSVYQQGQQHLQGEQWQLAANAANLSLKADPQYQPPQLLLAKAMVELLRPQLRILGFMEDPKGETHVMVEYSFADGKKETKKLREKDFYKSYTIEQITRDANGNAIGIQARYEENNKQYPVMFRTRRPITGKFEILEPVVTQPAGATPAAAQ